MSIPGKQDPAPQAAGTDGVIEKLSQYVADHQNRRSFLVRLASGTAALFGVGFGASFVLETGMKSRAEAASPAGRCRHASDDCSQWGLKCGFNNLRDCTFYKNKKYCKSCYDRNTGCPKGLTPGTLMWAACCICPDDHTKGTVVEYWDCCGDAANLDPDCTSSVCDAWAQQGGCADAGRCGPSQSWCGAPGGLPYCTYPVDTRKECPVT
jgi:hypothetical protein